MLFLTVQGGGSPFAAHCSHAASSRFMRGSNLFTIVCLQLVCISLAYLAVYFTSGHLER